MKLKPASEIQFWWDQRRFRDFLDDLHLWVFVNEDRRRVTWSISKSIHRVQARLLALLDQGTVANVLGWCLTTLLERCCMSCIMARGLTLDLDQNHHLTALSHGVILGHGDHDELTNVGGVTSPVLCATMVTSQLSPLSSRTRYTSFRCNVRYYYYYLFHP